MANSPNSVRSRPVRSRPKPKPAGRPKRLGAEVPRIWTPPLRRLTPKTSAGFECIRFAIDVLGIELFPWQKWTLIHALELLPDGTFRFRTVVLLVARQNGKSTLMQVLTLWRMYVDGAPLVIGTAQDLDTAEEQWQFVVDMAEEIPDLAAEIDQVLKVNGKKQLRLTSGERYKVRATGRRAGRGLSGDLVLLDELREHQTWEAWGAVTKTTLARARAQVWAASNAGDAMSVVLGFLRRLAHLALGDPDGINKDYPPVDEPDLTDEEELDGDSLGIFEYSAVPGCDKWDRDGWAQANPSMGHKDGITEKALASAARTDPEPVFRTECMCQWVVTLVEYVIPAEVWNTCLDVKSEIVGTPIFALDISPSQSWAAIAVAGMREDGLPHVEVTSSKTPSGLVIDHHEGADWVVPRAVQLKERWPGMKLAIISGSTSAAEALVPAFTEAGIELVFIKGGDVTAACGLFYLLATTKGLRHRGQPELTGALSTARKAVEDGEGAWRWGRKRSSADITPLYAATLALWAAIAASNTDMDPANNVW